MKKILGLFLLVLSALVLVACTETKVEIARLSVTPPTKVEYEVGEAFDATGMVVKAIYTDGTDKTLTSSEYELSGFSSATPGLVTVTVTYNEVTENFGVAIFDKEAPETALAIRILSAPDQQFYNVSEAFDATGLEVEVTYSTGRKEVLDASEYELSGFKQGVIGKYDVVVTFGELQASFVTQVRATTVQGVTDTSIKVGNTAAITGIYSSVGIPFVAGMKAAFEVINEAGGIDGRLIEYVNRDDGFDANVGITNTGMLINEDKVFALVGHFGTGTVAATIPTIREVGIPMVYAATGVNNLYFERSPLDPVMPVQPIYLTDGRIMTARALKEAVYGPNKDQKLGANDKVGVLYSAALDGTSIKEGVEIEAKTHGVNGNFIYQVFDPTNTAQLTTTIQSFKTAGVKSIIVAANQAGFKSVIGTMQAEQLNVPTFTSYVNADATAVDANTTYTFDIYTNAWVDILSEEGQASAGVFVQAMMGASFLTEAERTAYAGNSFAIAGYIAAINFIDGLKRVEANEQDLTWETFIKAMEEGPLDIPMGGTVDFSGGKRWGIASMSLLKYNSTTKTFDLVEGIETLETIQNK